MGGQQESVWPKALSADTDGLFSSNVQRQPVFSQLNQRYRGMSLKTAGRVVRYHSGNTPLSEKERWEERTSRLVSLLLSPWGTLRYTEQLNDFLPRSFEKLFARITWY